MSYCLLLILSGARVEPNATERFTNVRPLHQSCFRTDTFEKCPTTRVSGARHDARGMPWARQPTQPLHDGGLHGRWARPMALGSESKNRSFFLDFNASVCILNRAALQSISKRILSRKNILVLLMVRIPFNVDS